jgi:hypothetical protein
MVDGEARRRDRPIAKIESCPLKKPIDHDAGPPAPLDRHLQSFIGQKLKQFYDEIASEAIPDRFTALLDQLETKEAADGDKTEPAI